MDNFKAVYKILSTLEKSMDLPEADLESMDHKANDQNGVSFNHNDGKLYVLCMYYTSEIPESSFLCSL